MQVVQVVPVENYYFLFFALSLVIALAAVTTYLAVRRRVVKKSDVKVD